MIPTYNDRGWLAQAVDSCFSQGVADQLAVIDNGTTTLDVGYWIKQRYGRRDRVEYFRRDDDRGIVDAFNTCIDRARCDWVLIIGDDDRSLPGHHAAIKAVADAGECVAYWCREEVIDGAGKALGLTACWQATAGELFSSPWCFLLGANPVCFPGFAVRRDVLASVRFDERYLYCSDLLCWGRVAQRGKVWYDPMPRVQYRRHAKQYVATDVDLQYMRDCAEILRKELVTSPTHN